MRLRDPKHAMFPAFAGQHTFVPWQQGGWTVDGACGVVWQSAADTNGAVATCNSWPLGRQLSEKGSKNVQKLEIAWGQVSHRTALPCFYMNSVVACEQMACSARLIHTFGFTLRRTEPCSPTACADETAEGHNLPHERQDISWDKLGFLFVAVCGFGDCIWRARRM